METSLKAPPQARSPQPASPPKGGNLYLYRGHDLQSAEEIAHSRWAIRKTLPAGDYMIKATTWYRWRTGAFTLAVGEDLDPVPATTASPNQVSKTVL